MPTSEGLHENEASLDAAAIDRHRALASIGEELEAVDWYDQRAEATANGELASVLAHNRDEEKEHAAMTLEWLRRNDPALDRHLRTYLFTEDPIVAEEASARGAGTLRRSEPTHREEAAAEHGDAEPGVAPDATTVPEGSLGIGSLKEHRS